MHNIYLHTNYLDFLHWKAYLGDLFMSENRLLMILVCQQCKKLYWNIFIHLSVPLLREELKRLIKQ